MPGRIWFVIQCPGRAYSGGLSQTLGIGHDLMGSLGKRPPRELQEMVVSVKRHLRLLREYAQKAFLEADGDYGGEVAGKLRLLVTRFGSHRPLLLDLMQETGIQPKVTLGGPPVIREPGEPGPGDEITLAEYLELGAIGTRVPNGDFVMLKKTQFIRAWAEQTGSSHEDWEMDPALRAILSFPVYIGSLHGALAELRVTTETVLHIADRFLQVLETSGTESDSNDA